MSEKQFQEARQQLAFSQQLADRMRQENMAQPQEEIEEVSPETPMEEEVIEQPVEEEVNAEEPIEEEVVEEPKEEEEKEEKDEAGILSAFMDEIRALFKGKEDEEKKTQELVEKHNKEMSEIKQGITEILKEDEQES